MSNAGIIDGLSFELGKGPDDKLFSETAEGIVNELKGDRFGGKNNDKDKISTTQIRRFYNDLLSIKSVVELETPSKRAAAFRLQIPYVNMMVAKARYAKGRKVVGEKFVKYIEKCVEPFDSNRPAESYEHFKVFCSLFESVVAYASDIIGD